MGVWVTYQYVPNCDTMVAKKRLGPYVANGNKCYHPTGMATLCILRLARRSEVIGMLYLLEEVFASNSKTKDDERMPGKRGGFNLKTTYCLCFVRIRKSTTEAPTTSLIGTTYRHFK